MEHKSPLLSIKTSSNVASSPETASSIASQAQALFSQLATLISASRRDSRPTPLTTDSASAGLKTSSQPIPETHSQDSMMPLFETWQITNLIAFCREAYVRMQEYEVALEQLRADRRQALLALRLAQKKLEEPRP